MKEQEQLRKDISRIFSIFKASECSQIQYFPKQS